MPDHLDRDSDEDGIPDAVEARDLNGDLPPFDVADAVIDTDGDGLRDVVDRDSDNDGLPDAIEALEAHGLEVRIA